jgi:flagellar protein FliO/FliZ
MKNLFLLSGLPFVLPTTLMAATVDKQDKVPHIAHGPVDVTVVFQVLAALILIVVLIIGLAWGYRRYGFSHSAEGAAMKVVGAISLGGKEKAVLLQVGDDQVLLGVSPGYVRKIHDIKEPVMAAESNNPNSFVNKLNIELQRVLRK